MVAYPMSLEHSPAGVRPSDVTGGDGAQTLLPETSIATEATGGRPKRLRLAFSVPFFITATGLVVLSTVFLQHDIALEHEIVAQRQQIMALRDDLALAIKKERTIHAKFDAATEAQKQRVDLLVAHILERNPSLGDAYARTLAWTFHVAADHYKVDERLLVSICGAESDFRAFASSTKGAIGICQVMPFWAQRLGLIKSPADLTNFWTNIRAAAAILRYYLDRCGPNWQGAVSCYHGGPGSLEHPEVSTVHYLATVTRRLYSFERM
jgi:soluble lytic murein transglycosylase-like protein